MIKSQFGITALALCFILVASTALAAAPELRGTWKGTAKIQTLSKVWEGQAAFVIDEQNGHTFTGYKLWFGKDKVLQREAFVGVFDGEELLIAEQVDGICEGHLTSKQSMKLRYAEPGATLKAILYTLERVHFTTGFVEIDKNGDSVIMQAEITTHYPLNAERIIKEADTNNDGKLTKKEWEAWRKANTK